MAFSPCARLDSLWIGEMRSVVVDGVRVVLVHLEDGLHAYVDRCAHAAARMSEGYLDGNVLTCSAHYWSYDARTGRGINPEQAQLRKCAVRVEGEQILVDVAVTDPALPKPASGVGQ